MSARFAIGRGFSTHPLRLVGTALLLSLTLSLGGCNGSGGGNSVTQPVSTTPAPGTSNANAAPTINGTPTTTAKSSLPYSFKPDASDPNGDPLSFQIQGKPDWASFDATTGLLSGTPPQGLVGTYANIQITVSDGKTTTALPTFTLSVVPPSIGSAALNWEAPTTNEDGSPMTDLSGYVIRYGRDPASLDQQIRIGNPGMTSYVVDNLIEGTWFFSLSSLNGQGIESRPTGVVSKAIS